jgi:hypothetical protein
VRCWGSNETGQLGLGGAVGGTHQTPSPIAITGAKALALGDSHTCALLSDGTMACWGANTAGQLGLGPQGAAMMTSPTAVPDLKGVTQIAAGGDSTCALLTGAKVKCWGANDAGQLGIGKGGNQSAPTALDVPGDVMVNSVALGQAHGCIVADGGHLRCWGNGQQGQLGIGQFSNQQSPHPVEGIKNVLHVALGGRHTCARTQDGVQCWGDNTSYELGIIVDSNSAVTTPTMSAFSATDTSLALGGVFSCGLRDDQAIECAGNNDSGQLGNSTTIYPLPNTPTTPQAVLHTQTSILLDVAQVAAGKAHACARLNSGEVDCWGDNTSGQLGSAAMTPVTLPAAVIW